MTRCVKSRTYTRLPWNTFWGLLAGGLVAVVEHDDFDPAISAAFGIGGRWPERPLGRIARDPDASGVDVESLHPVPRHPAGTRGRELPKRGIVREGSGLCRVGVTLDANEMGRGREHLSDRRK